MKPELNDLELAIVELETPLTDDEKLQQVYERLNHKCDEIIEKIRKQK